ncbi:MAG: TIGR02391 family protein, partial [Dehalococcoidia bacterium]
MPAIREFSQAEMEQVCAILADTGSGLTGSEIGRLLAQLKIHDPTPTVTKRHRLFNALAARQTQTRSGNVVGAFIEEAMKPVRHTGTIALFEWRRDGLNEILAFPGYALGEDGKLRLRAQPARTLTQAEEAAGHLRSELSRRAVHPDVLKFCRAELLRENYFHAVFEATKSVADKIRDKADING